jgi:hypothetical protein
MLVLSNPPFPNAPLGADTVAVQASSNSPVPKKGKGGVSGVVNPHAGIVIRGLLGSNAIVPAVITSVVSKKNTSSARAGTAMSIASTVRTSVLRANGRLCFTVAMDFTSCTSTC